MTTTDDLPTDISSLSCIPLINWINGTSKYRVEPRALARWLERGLLAREAEVHPVGRLGRLVVVRIARKDKTLVPWIDGILMTEPRPRQRAWDCVVGFSATSEHLTGYRTSVECSLAARQWFIRHGVSPDSPIRDF